MKMSTQVDLFTEVETTTSSLACVKPLVSRSTFYQGDCLVEMDKIADKSVDAIICDLPYGTTNCKWDSVIPFEPLWKHYNRIIKNGCPIVLFGSQPFTTLLIQSNFDDFKYALVWSKKMTSGFANAKYQPMKAHEDILIFGKGKVTYNPQMTERDEAELKRLSHKSVVTTKSEHRAVKGISGNRYDNKLKYPNSIINIPAVMNNSPEKLPHSTQKSLAIMEYLIKTYTNEGETVLDNCMGSGTTGVACKNLGRNFIGIEKDQKYFEIAKNRINEYK